MDIQEKIDAYFAGTLSEKEIKDLELLVKENPEFQKEFELQKDISEAFKELRFAELKAQLNSVQIPPASVAPPWVKILSTVAIVSGISIIGYFIFKPANSVQPTKSPQQEISTPNEVIPEEIKADKPGNNKTEKKEEVVKEEKTAESKPANPIPVKPNIIEDFQDDETTDSISVPENTAMESSAFSNSSVAIEVKQNTQYNFHYRFSGDRLFLYGDFTDDLYNILEFKDDSISQLFFFYKDAYYYLDKKQTEITPLKVITEPDLIKNLDSLREKK